MTPCYLIGVAGGSASGKSTFSKALVIALRQAGPSLTVEMLSTDAYFLPHDRVPRYLSPTFGAEIPDYNSPDSLDLPRLLADLDARRAAPDHPDVLVLEGLMLLHHADIRERLDLRLFIELDADQRALRRLVRNIGHQYDPIGADHSPRAIANYFLESAKVGHEKYIEPSRRYADLILRGDGDFERAAVLVAGAALHSKHPGVTP